ncbi:hypothetical protein C4N9_20910 [Pararhodobacter marinus]|uniref:Uncharacterized protein n=1 Tax=Pararhodobacter marinus TaxID=2184063 RepID=A0A2U2C4D2_9RHOB|nr:hypothetical protein [Pararhodobacter marinus]PWE26722.1 hypothetical protein C4N9_20910 [Pararhodobacter marinus]
MNMPVQSAHFNGHNATQAKLSRRRLLTAAPAAGLAAMMAGATPVEADNQSPLREIYWQWQEAKATFNALPDDISDGAEGDAAYQRIVHFEEQASAYEPQTLDDMLMKVIFADNNGDMRTGSIFQAALVAQAYEMAGIEAAA